MIFGGLECPVQEILKEFRALAPEAPMHNEGVVRMCLHHLVLTTSSSKVLIVTNSRLD